MRTGLDRLDSDGTVGAAVESAPHNIISSPKPPPSLTHARVLLDAWENWWSSWGWGTWVRWRHQGRVVWWGVGFHSTSHKPCSWWGTGIVGRLSRVSWCRGCLPRVPWLRWVYRNTRDSNRSGVARWKHSRCKGGEVLLERY